MPQADNSHLNRYIETVIKKHPKTGKETISKIEVEPSNKYPECNWMIRIYGGWAHMKTKKGVSKFCKKVWG